MPNRRMDEGHEETEKIIKEITKELNAEYGTAKKDLEEKVNKFFSDLKVKNDRKLSDLQDGKITKSQYDDWLRRQLTTGERWKAMRDTIARDLENTDKIASSIINGHMPEVYSTNFNFAAYQVERESMVDTSFTLYNSKTVERLVRDNPRLLPKSKDIPANKQWSQQKMKSAIMQGILQGESIDKIARRLMGVTDMHMNVAIRNARTMCTSAQNGGRQDAYERASEMGIDVKNAWMATLDDRTRDSHVLLDGEVVEVGEEFSNGCKFPGDPDCGDPAELYNCRCALVPVVMGINPALDENRNSKLGDMTYEEWKARAMHEDKQTEPQRELQFNQVDIGKANSVDEVNGILNNSGFFTSGCDLTGCDLDSAKSIAASYEQVFTKFPILQGMINGVDAQPTRMGPNTYAWCFIRGGGKVQVNPTKYNNWKMLERGYEQDVISGWHPRGTTAESIVTHEIGHAVDGLLAKKGVLGGYTKSGEFRYASSSMKTTVMKRAAKKDEVLGQIFEIWGNKEGMNMVVHDYVSGYATKNPQEWFAECFAEYITSANPRVVAEEFGKELEKLLAKLEKGGK